jgi:hypothetical protein
MTLVAAPASLAATLAQFAVQKAREDVKGRGWKSSGALQPVSGQGQIGIRSTMKGLLYQNAGIRSFLMYWAEGRVVPMGCKQGDGPHMRIGKGVGQPGYVNIPHKGRIWRNQKWKYPGLKPKRFIEAAIAGAIRDNRDLIRAEIKSALTGQDRGEVQL